MQESVARTKRCPVLKIFNVTSSQEEVTLHRIPHCIGSDCMMWRMSYDNSDDGFCGLAGGTGSASMGFPPGTGTHSSPPTPPTSPPPPAPAPTRPGVLPRR